MSRFKRFEIVKRSPSYSISEASIFTPRRSVLLNPCFPSFTIVKEEFDYVSDFLTFAPTSPVFSDDFDVISDLIQMEDAPFHLSNRWVTRNLGLGCGADLYLQSICDRVSDLELGFGSLVKEKTSRKKIGERKYTWTTEIKSPEKVGFDRKYKWTAEINDGKNENKGIEKSYKWTAEIKGKGRGCVPIERTYTLKVSNRDGSCESKKDKKKKKSEETKGEAKAARIVEIESPSNHGAVVLRQAFAKRVEKSRDKRKVLSLQDAATLIQVSFRAYLIRRSQALRALRELAIAKTKLKEIRVLFNNFSYRRRLTRDAEEQQRFSEKLIVLLLTVDAIEGADLMVRAAKKAMVDELEAMLDVVDPQPPGKSVSMKRRTFDMPDGTINKELAAGIEQVVQMLDEEAIL